MPGKSSKRGLKICCGVSAVLVFLLFLTLLILFFTILKPKQPIVTPLQTTLDSFKFTFFPAFRLNVTLGLGLSIDNKNYASFKYGNSTSQIDYQGQFVAEADIAADTIPARAKHNITTSVTILADKLISNPSFWWDNTDRILNFTTNTKLHGKSTLLKIFKIKTSTTSDCNVSVNLQAQTSLSVCTYKVTH